MGKQKHKRARKLVVIEKPVEPKTGLVKRPHLHLFVGSVLVAISALLFGFESLEIQHQLEFAGISTAFGTILILIATW